LIEGVLLDLSDSEETRDKGEPIPDATLLRRRGMFGPKEDLEEMDEIEDDRDRDVEVVESDDTDAGEDVKGVVVLIGSS
jgi:hypothetical protein